MNGRYLLQPTASARSLKNDTMAGSKLSDLIPMPITVGIANYCGALHIRVHDSAKRISASSMAGDSAGDRTEYSCSSRLTVVGSSTAGLNFGGYCQWRLQAQMNQSFLQLSRVTAYRAAAALAALHNDGIQKLALNAEQRASPRHPEHDV